MFVYLIIIIIIEGLSLLQSIPPTTADKQTQAQKRRGSRSRKLLGAKAKSVCLPGSGYLDLAIWIWLSLRAPQRERWDGISVIVFYLFIYARAFCHIYISDFLGQAPPPFLLVCWQAKGGAPRNVSFVFFQNCVAFDFIL